MAATQNRPPLVIGLTGPFGAGSTTVASVLEKMGCQGLSLPAPIKKKLAEQELEEARQWEDKLRVWEKGPHTDAAPEKPIISLQERRRRLQDVGNDGRKTAPDYWLDKALEGVDCSKDLVIPSIRNPGEIEGLRARFANSFVIAVVASKEVRWRRVQSEYDGNRKLFDRDDQRDTEDEEGAGPAHEEC